MKAIFVFVLKQHVENPCRPKKKKNNQKIASSPPGLGEEFFF